MRTLGTVFVMSGPSGAGKSSVVDQLLATDPNLHFSVSCTTRAPRIGERHGHDYYFVTREEFETRLRAGEFLEYAEVHGQLYGTLNTEVTRFVDQGGDVLLDIDVQGVATIRRRIDRMDTPYHFRFIFVGPPSFQELERRLRTRGTETEETMSRRLKQARHELDQWRNYDYLIINTQLDQAIEQARAILQAERARTTRIRDDRIWE